MGRPRLYRDPVHLQLRYERADASTLPEPGRKRLGWLIRELMDCREFQRLRHIRQNGLANLVFHGAEHSRFGHSMGVAHLAERMFVHICRNMDEEIDEGQLLATCAAALLHDIGHGPFSHTLEEILKDVNVKFNHERMTLRIIEDSGIRRVLDQVDGTFSGEITTYIQKERPEDHWRYKVVSSQLDADRLDYLLRDGAAAGIRGHTYDLGRLLDMLRHLDGKRIAVDRKGLETVEGYLVALDHMYRVVYFHHTVRAASALLSSILRRAVAVSGLDSTIIGSEHPLVDLVENGENCDLQSYLRLGEYHLWVLIEQWCQHSDPVLADLSQRLMARCLFKTIELDTSDFNGSNDIIALARDLTIRHIPHVNSDTVQYYVTVDEAKRTSYKRYDWRAAVPDESVWVIDEKPVEIENYSRSRLITGLKDTRFFAHLCFPEEIRRELITKMEAA